MEVAVAVLTGLYFAVSIYLMLSQHIIRILLGTVTLSTGANLTIFAMGRITREVPPIIPDGQYLPAEGAANALPQALVLTAIVIAFSLFAFLLVLVMRSYQELGTDDTEAMRDAEPRGEPLPPLGY
ncbi:MAG: Na+/H+ antiporter subunit C [Roseitalea porphyridii]|jgi:multicomponent Na+:H+ antiporter subunit C|uniref:Na+/H+ antiporter subunit C n=1 Tax=Roseitalea porphyridii TaxID=1852022 RepID=UPI0032D94327